MSANLYCYIPPEVLGEVILHKIDNILATAQGRQFQWKTVRKWYAIYKIAQFAITSVTSKGHLSSSGPI